SSFPDMILTVYQDGRLLPQVTHIVPGRGLLERLEAGDYDAVLVDIHRFDGYRNEHPETALRLSDFLHPAGFNLAFVGLSSDQELMRTINATLDTLMNDGTVEGLAKKAGVTYLPPRAPAIRPTPTLDDLRKD